MYTEGFEGLEEAEKEPRRTYVGMHDTEKLLRENEKLKKSLEKEQFFNKLLDQEIQELKGSIPGGTNQNFRSEYWSGSRGVSKGAFYSLLVVTLLLAAYIGYGIYYNKPINYLNIGQSSPAAAAVVESDPGVTAGTGVSAEATTPPANDNAATTPPLDNRQPVEAASAGKETSGAAVTPPIARDSVPTIIGGKKTVANEKPASVPNKPAAQKASVTPVADEQYNEEEVNAAIEENDSKPAPVAAKPVEENRPVIARYKVTSKANFYNSPDEASMRGTFISGSINKTVEALEEKNGFIFVVYKNDLGFTSRGWLSKQDLTKE